MSYADGAAALSPQDVQLKGDGGGGGGATTPLTALPGAVDSSDLGVSSRDDVEKRSQASKDPRYDHFQVLDEDWKTGLTIEDYESADGSHRDVIGTAGTTKKGMSEDEAKGAKQKLRADTGVRTMSEYRTMLRNDFNFGGVVQDYGGRVEKDTPEAWQRVHDDGEPHFIADVVKRFYPGKGVDDPAVATCVHIARNIWSYATLGCDVGGATDIGQLQGLLYVFDAQIRGQSDVNTEMSDETFMVPGTEENPVYLRLGDAKHGRATTLTTRHLLSDMTGGDAKGDDTTLSGYAESHLLLDNTGSMVNDEFAKLASVLEAGGIDGQVALASYSTDGSSLAHVGADLGDTQSKDSAAKVLTQTARDVEAGGGHVAGDGSSARLGNVHGRSTVMKGDGDVRVVEKGLDAAVAYLTKLPKLPPRDYKRRQLVLFTDEPDASPEKFDEVHALATAKQVDVKIVYSFSSAEAPLDAEGKQLDDQFAVIDLMAIPELLSAWVGDRDETEAVFWERVIADRGLEVRKWSDIAAKE